MAIKHLEFDSYGYIDGASITGAYQDVLSLSDDADVLFVFNTCNQALVVQLPSARTTAEIRLPSGANLTIDCRNNSKRLAKGTIKVKHAGVAPTSGEVCASVLR